VHWIDITKVQVNHEGLLSDGV